MPKNNKPLTTKIFVERANKKHSEENYDYSKVEYVNANTKVCIICSKHGEFWQHPHKHLRGQGCRKCKGEKIANKKLYSQEKFLSLAIEKHKNKYDYSKVKYITARNKVCIVCPKHGEFWQTPMKHLQGQGCPMCMQNKPLTKEEFIKKSKKMHNGKYDYSNIEFKNVNTKISILCPKHGEFKQKPIKHIIGQGCPICAQELCYSETRLFEELKKLLPQYTIIRQQKFPWLTKNKSLDIYIEELDLAIEYQGEQHFWPIEYFGGKNKFTRTQMLDNEKYNECKNNNTKLLYFSFVKKLPNTYLDTIYNQVNDLVNEIVNYANYRGYTTII